MNNHRSSASRLPLCLGLIAALGMAASAYGQDAPTRAIVEIADDLYRAQNNNHHVLFMVTDEGIILADTVNTDFMTWLKGELDSRFADRQGPSKFISFTGN